MSLTTKNQLLIAYKKLVGKSHTNAQFGDANEVVGSGIQINNSTIIAQSIPASPNTALYSITSGTVERVQFDLEPISLSQYTAVNGGTSITSDGDGSPAGTLTNGIHAFKLKLPSDYSGSSTNPKRGPAPFSGSQILSDALGRLQIIPPSYGITYYPTVSHSAGVINPFDQEDYYLDTFSGILFVQDIQRVPTSVTAYLYVGEYLSDIVATGSLSASGPDKSVQFNSGSQFSGSSTLIYDYDTLTLSGTTAQFTYVTSSDVLLYGTASLSNNPLELAYVTYNSSIDKIEIFPGLNISGSSIVNGNLNVTGTISASNYIGINIDLPKLIVSSSVSLSMDQRAVFAKNSVSSSFSITLPSASLADSREYYVIKADSASGSVSVLPSSPNLINGSSSFELNGPYQSIVLIHDGTNWYVF